MSIQKKFNLKSLGPQNIAASGTHYFDLGKLPKTGFALGFMRLFGSQPGTWEFRYNTAGVDTGNDGSTQAFNHPGPLTVLTAANAADDIELANNNTIAPLNARGDGTQKVWLKVTNTGLAAGDFHALVGAAESGYMSWAD